MHYMEHFLTHSQQIMNPVFSCVLQRVFPYNCHPHKELACLKCDLSQLEEYLSHNLLIIERIG